MHIITSVRSQNQSLIFPLKHPLNRRLSAISRSNILYLDKWLSWWRLYAVIIFTLTYTQAHCSLAFNRPRNNTLTIPYNNQAI